MQLALVTALAAALLLLGPAPDASLAALTSATAPGSGTAADPTGAVTAAVALLAWCLLAWSTLLLALAGLARVPGSTGRASAALGRRLAPRAVRVALAVLAGTSVAGAPGVASAQAPPSVAPAVSLDWPGAAAGVPVPAPPPAPDPAPPAATAPRDHVVAPGDTLWDLAEQRLGPGATAGQVAATWPSWWAANREAVGPDPHLLQPGTRLTPPAG